MRMHDTIHTLNHWYQDPQSMHKYAYAYTYTCVQTHRCTNTYTHAYIYTYIHVHTCTHTHNIHRHIQNVHMNARKHAWNDGVAANARGAVVERGNFASLFRSTQSNHRSHLQYKDFIVPTSWNINTPPPPIPSSQYTPEQFADCGQTPRQFYCSTLIRWTECIALKKLRAASQWPLA